MNANCKKAGVLIIKYAPSVLALTCCAKILLNVMSDVEKDCYLFAVNWINWALNVGVLSLIWMLGRCFGLCWKHQSLCRASLWGYIYYAFFLISGVPKKEVLYISILYVAVVLVLTVTYKGLGVNARRFIAGDENTTPEVRRTKYGFVWAVSHIVLVASIIEMACGVFGWVLLATVAMGAVLSIVYVLRNKV